MMTKTKTDTKSKGPCRYDSLTRTKFFHGMLLTDEHLSAEQTYHREALKRMNRHMWGAGVVCGLSVKTAGGLCIRIEPGMALDCHGNVIEVCKPVTIELAELCDQKYPEGCPPENEAKITKYVVLRFAEVAADPAPVLSLPDDCSPTDRPRCEASKYREGFCVEFLDECPDADPCASLLAGDEGIVPILIKVASQDIDLYEIQTVLKERAPSCMESPPCPRCDCDDCGVGIAKVIVNCATRKVDEVTCDCRMNVWSPRFIRWLICRIFGRIDRLGGVFEGLPSADALGARPLPALWQAGGLLVSRTKERDRPSDVDVKAAGREKGSAPKTKPTKE